MAYDVADFQRDVIELSHKTPVLVDFWAPWCGPCRVLGPVLEKLATENTNHWKLVKVNTDEYQEISVQYGIKGIPAVKLFVEGEVINEFTGALPEHAVRNWLEEAIPSEEAKLLAASEAAIASGDAESGIQGLRDILANAPENQRARLLLAQATALNDVSEAGKLLDGIDVNDVAALEVVESIKVLSRLTQMAEEGQALPDEQGKEDYQEAVLAIVNSDWDRALEKFIAVIQQNRYYDDDGSRKAVIAIFGLLDTHHPLTLKHRRMFDMVLY